MLTVGVALHRHVVALAQRVLVSRLHRAPDSEIERQPQYAHAKRPHNLRRLVGRSVIHDDDVVFRYVLA